MRANVPRLWITKINSMITGEGLAGQPLNNVTLQVSGIGVKRRLPGESSETQYRCRGAAGAPLKQAHLNWSAVD